MTWLCIPSARPRAEAESVLSKWRRQGYRLAIWRDPGAEPVDCDILIQRPYPGYAIAVNALCLTALRVDKACGWCVAAGDDTLPDPNRTSDEIASELTVLFHGTFGVCQPTGDPWSDAAGRMIERIAGSPWIGRRFAELINGGEGPYWPGYTHCFLDNELMDVAKLVGVFVQRRDLVHHHAHWSRLGQPMPLHLEKANSKPHWDFYRDMYFTRKANGFPGYEPIRA